MKKTSIVFPLYNEEQRLNKLFKGIKNFSKAKINKSYEFIFVDDGSTDRTFDKLAGWAKIDKSVKVISLSRNFGKEAAMTAGLKAASGDAVIFMDVDLQDPAELIEHFIEKWNRGFDVVYARRVTRPGDSWLKVVTASLYRFTFNRLSEISIPIGSGDYRLIDRKVGDALLLLNERNRFMKGIFAWVGFRTTSIPFERASRVGGKSQWNYWKLWNFGLDGIVGFSNAPLRFWLYLGLFVFLLSSALAFLIIIQKLFFGINPEGYSSLMVAVPIFGGLQLLALGVIGEYVGRILIEIKGRPLFFVDKTIGFENRIMVKNGMLDNDKSQ